MTEPLSQAHAGTEDRRSGADRRSNFRRALDTFFARTSHTGEEPVSLPCQQGVHQHCVWFCPACGAECACPCHGL